MGGGMEANKNKFIEDWGAARENLEHNFRWTRRNLALVGIFAVAVPYLVYKGTVREFINKRTSMKVFSRSYDIGNRHLLSCRSSSNQKLSIRLYS
ncbi:hypothetical protein Tco_0602446 [Tanacetum coccineum]